jgi:hypothetical protein
MVPLPLAVKAEMLRGGSEKTDYRNLWRAGRIAHRHYFTGAVRNENTSCKAFGSFLKNVCFAVFRERDLLRDLVDFLIAYQFNMVLSEAVKGGRLYRTESDYKEVRSGMSRT